MNQQIDLKLVDTTEESRDFKIIDMDNNSIPDKIQLADDPEDKTDKTVTNATSNVSSQNLKMQNEENNKYDTLNESVVETLVIIHINIIYSLIEKRFDEY